MSANTLYDFGYMYSPSFGITYRPTNISINNQDYWNSKPTGLYNDNGTLVVVYNPTGRKGQVFRDTEAYKSSGMRILPVIELNGRAHRVGDTIKYQNKKYKVVDKGNNTAGLEEIISKPIQQKVSQPNTKQENKSTTSTKPKLVSKSNKQQSKISENEYIVQQGDNLSSIAKRAGMPLKTLIDQNPQIKDPNKIFVGDKIKLIPKNKAKQSTTENTQVSFPSFSSDIQGIPENKRMIIDYLLSNEN